ncbi:MAG: response regulator transcription factor, partial [Tepidisphaerales bacterium]
MTSNPGPTIPGSPSRILLVDDHPIVLEGLVARLEEEPDLSVCGTAADAYAAMDAIGKLNPDLVVTDLSLGTKPGLELIKDITKAHPELPTLVLSIHDETL